MRGPVGTLRWGQVWNAALAKASVRRWMELEIVAVSNWEPRMISVEVHPIPQIACLPVYWIFIGNGEQLGFA
jgi:hypothetical protein